MTMNYITRLCWNECGWENPSGIAKQLENSDTFCAINGFGFEEWLFSNDFLVDGYRYGFVQGVKDSQKKLAGQTINVYFYTIDQKQRYYVGEITNCHVLTVNSAEDILSKMENRGIVKRMISEVYSVNGNAGYIDEMAYKKKNGLELFNIRFKANDLTVYQKLIEIPKVSDVWQKRYGRYKLYEASENEIKLINNSRGKRKGA